MNMSLDVKYLMVRGQRWEQIARIEMPEIQMVQFAFLCPALNKNIQFRIEPSKQTGMKDLRRRMVETIDNQLTTEGIE